MSKLFEWILPASWRRRPEIKPEQNDAVLARLDEKDPTYRALMDHAYVQFENDVMAALQPKLSDEDRNFLCGRGNAMAAYITTIENTRDRARAEARERQRIAEAKQKPA